MAAKRIERLSAEAERLIPVVRDEWLAAGLSCEPTDRERAVAGVKAAYAAAGLSAPGLVIWLRSPFGGVIGSAMLANGGQVEGQVWDQVAGQVWDQVAGQVEGQVGRQVLDQVEGQVWDHVWDQVYKSLRGQHEAGWLSFYDFFRRAYNLKTCERLTGQNEVALSAGWWWPFQNAVVLTDRPIALHRDDEGRLHHESRLAIEYADGWGVWAWHGVRVPQHVIEHPETITATEVLEEENAEIRRVMIERMTPERFLTEASAQPVQQDDYGKLWRVDLDDDEPLVMVELLNSTVEPDGTQRTYFLRVDPGCTTARGAAAWTFGMLETDYVLAAQS